MSLFRSTPATEPTTDAPEPVVGCDACGRTDTCTETHVDGGVSYRVCVRPAQCQWRTAGTSPP